MTDSEQLRRQNQSLLSLLTEIDQLILAINDICEFDGDARVHWAKLLSGARARDTANHAGDMIAGGEV